MIKLLPFRHKQINNLILLTNEVGQYYFISPSNFTTLLFTPDKLPTDILNDLKSNFFVCEHNYLDDAIDELAIKLRTKKDFLNYFTSLHIIIISHNCNSNCTYCHASSNSKKRNKNLDLSLETAKEICKKIIQCPSDLIKVEFQGGEPTLNFETIVFIVSYMKYLNKKKNKIIEYVLCTNLLSINIKQFDFIKKNNIYISTSLDGPPHIHNKNRLSINNNNNYDLVTNNIKHIQKQYGTDKVSALMTISKYSLDKIEECIDCYINLGLKSIFLRPLNPYGMAEKNQDFLSYTVEEYLNYYEKGLLYILNKNIEGILISEEFACVFLRKILTPFSNGFVDIQSPSGNGIGCAVYDINGKVFVSDEARMLSKFNDDTFCLGNVCTNSYKEIFNNIKLHEIIKNNINEADINCFACPYIPYCGKDSVRTYQEKILHIENTNCKKYKGVIDILFKLILENEKYLDVFWSWITYRPYSEVQL